jgi:hypothetical protein
MNLCIGDSGVPVVTSQLVGLDAGGRVKSGNLIGQLFFRIAYLMIRKLPTLQTGEK